MAESRAIAGKPRNLPLYILTDTKSEGGCLFRLILLVAADVAMKIEYNAQ